MAKQMTMRAKRMAEKRQAQAESAARIAEAQAEARAVLASGRCPLCGSGVHHNLALTGWVQCDQYGAETHRKDPTKPACSWQGFTR